MSENEITSDPKTWYGLPLGRQSGKTSQQILSLPHGGLFIVWNRDMRNYSRHLARYLGRPDVIIKSITSIQQIHMELSCRRYPGYKIDHAFYGYCSPQFLRNERLEDELDYCCR